MDAGEWDERPFTHAGAPVELTCQARRIPEWKSDYLGLVGNESETIDLRLHAGRNELVLAVTDKAFGWGFRAKIDSLDGLTIVP